MDTYIVININNLGSVDFSQVLETSSSTVRISNNGLMLILKYRGVEPSSLVSIPKISIDGRQYHSKEQMLEIITSTGDEGWQADNPII